MATILEGSDLTSKLTEVVTTFRKDRVAFMAAIDECFFKSRFQRKIRTSFASYGGQKLIQLKNLKSTALLKDAKTQFRT